MISHKQAYLGASQSLPFPMEAVGVWSQPVPLFAHSRNINVKLQLIGVEFQAMFSQFRMSCKEIRIAGVDPADWGRGAEFCFQISAAFPSRARQAAIASRVTQNAAFAICGPLNGQKTRRPQMRRSALKRTGGGDAAVVAKERRILITELCAPIN